MITETISFSALAKCVGEAGLARLRTIAISSTDDALTFDLNNRSYAVVRHTLLAAGAIPKPPAPVMTPVTTRPTSSLPLPIPRADWPRWAKFVHKLRKRDDRGIGDTVKRLAGRNGKRFKRWYLATAGEECGCANRQHLWNAIYPYDQ